MPNFTNTARFNKLPVTGFVPEKSGTAPTDPVAGQVWVDTSATPNVVRTWDGTSWVLLQRYAGTGAENFIAGNDGRVSGALQAANNLSDIPNDATARTNLGLGTAAITNTGTGATNTILGNDARLSDQRVPTDGSVTGGTAGAGVKIAASTITAANLAATLTDGTAGTKQIRALGTGATDAAAGNLAEYTSRKNAASGYAGLDASSKLAFSQLPTAASGATTANTVVIATDARLSDTRTPTAGTVVDASVAANAAIAESKLALASDAAAGTASRRTLGTGAQQAMPGNTTLSTLAAPTGAVNLNSQKITNLGAPTLATDAARLQDVQNAAAGIDVKPSVRAGTTGNITLSGTQTIDGVAVVAGDRVLVKNQTTATQNGSYVVAAGAWARTDDVISANSFWFIEEGTALADTSWMVTNNGEIVLGTTPLAFAQFAGAGTIGGTANRITVSGNTVDIAATYVGQTSITTLGTITTGTWAGTDVAIAHGGTGASTAAAARTNLGASQKGYAANLGAVTAGTPVTITHNLGTQDVVTQVRDASTNEVLFGDIINASANTVTFTSGIAYAASALRVTVVPAT